MFTVFFKVKISPRSLKIFVRQRRTGYCRKWLNEKNLSNVTDRALKTATSEGYDGENDDFDGFTMDELENTFLLWSLLCSMCLYNVLHRVRLNVLFFYWHVFAEIDVGPKSELMHNYWHYVYPVYNYFHWHEGPRCNIQKLGPRDQRIKSLTA